MRVLGGVHIIDSGTETAATRSVCRGFSKVTSVVARRSVGAKLGTKGTELSMICCPDSLAHLKCRVMRKQVLSILALAAPFGLAGLATYVHSHHRKAKLCRTVSTRSYRSRLKEKGCVLTGLEIDHIVPHALGGADHPANYQLLPRSENRRLGKSWGPAKCASVGKRRCRAAIDVSMRCGSFQLRTRDRSPRFGQA